MVEWGLNDKPEVDWGLNDRPVGTVVLPDPVEEEEQINETLNLSDEYEINPTDGMKFVAGPEPSLFGRLLGKVKETIRERMGYFEPPIYGPEYREEKPFRTAGKMAAYYGAETISGLTLTALDVLASKTKGDKTLADSIARITGFEPTPEEKEIGESAKYIATFTPAGKLVGVATKVIPASALKTILDSGLTFASTDAAIQFSKNITQNTPVDWEQIHAAGGVGILFGMGEVAVAAVLTGLVKGIDKYWGEKGIDLASKIRPPGTTLEEQVARQETEIRADINRAKETFRKTGKMPEDLMEKYVYGKPPEGSVLAPKEVKVSPTETLAKAVQETTGITKEKAAQVAKETIQKFYIPKKGELEEMQKPAGIRIEAPTPPVEAGKEAEGIETKPYIITAYRGTSEQTPVDEGMYGKGTYYTTDKNYAANFGKVTEHKITLNNPFFVKNIYELEELARPTLEKAIASGTHKYSHKLNELQSRTIRNILEERGYDGIVIAKGMTGGEQEIVSFKSQPVIPAAPEAKPAEKQPWKMTKEEFKVYSEGIDKVIEETTIDKELYSKLSKKQSQLSMEIGKSTKRGQAVDIHPTQETIQREQVQKEKVEKIKGEIEQLQNEIREQEKQVAQKRNKLRPDVFDEQGNLRFGVGEKQHYFEVAKAIKQGKPIPPEVLAEYPELAKGVTKPKKKISAKEEFKIGDVINTKGQSNMADPITIREIKGNTLKFIDAEGTEYFGMARATVRRLIEGRSWERIIPTAQPTEAKPVPKPIVSEVETAPRPVIKPGEVPGGGIAWHTSIREGIKQSKEIRPKIVMEQRAERRKRAGAYEGIKKWLKENKGLSAKEALFRATSAFRGPLTEYQRFQPLSEILSEDTINSAYDDIYSSERLRPYERAAVTEAFEKLEGGYMLEPHEAELLKKWQPVLADVIDARTERSSIYKMVTSLWRAGLLTGIKTSGLNTFSNLSHAITETMKDIPAFGFDSVQSLFTGKRTLAFTTKGTISGAKEGFVKGWEYLRSGFDERDIGAKYDYYKVNFGKSKLAKGLQTYEEFIFHLMGAEDQPFYYGAKARSLYNQAIAEGMNQGHKGKVLTEFAENLVQNPTDEMLDIATHDAEMSVFQNKTKLGDIGSAIQKAGGEIIVPFARTPSAIAMQIINYTPVGTVKEVAQQIRKGKYDQRLLSQALGRSTVGVAALYLGALLLKHGFMTLGYPDNERERKLWEVEGRKENSIKIGDKWRSVYVLGPAGNVLIIGGYFQKAYDETGSPTKAMITAMAGGAKSFSEETFVRGLSQAAEAVSDPERSFERYFSQLAGSVVPTLVSDIARATDTTERMAYTPTKRFASKIPGLRETLEPRMDVFGQDVPRYGGNSLEIMIDPTRPVKIREDIVVDELRRLWNKDIKVSPTMLGDKTGYEILTDYENTVLWRRAGELTYIAIFELIQSPNYKLFSDEKRGKEIEKEVQEAKNMARAEAAMAKMETGSTSQELKESKLVTEDVEKHIRRITALGGL